MVAFNPFDRGPMTLAEWMHTIAASPEAPLLAVAGVITPVVAAIASFAIWRGAIVRPRAGYAMLAACLATLTAQIVLGAYFLAALFAIPSLLLLSALRQVRA